MKDKYTELEQILEIKGKNIDLSLFISNSKWADFSEVYSTFKKVDESKLISIYEHNGILRLLAQKCDLLTPNILEKLYTDQNRISFILNWDSALKAFLEVNLKALTAERKKQFLNKLTQEKYILKDWINSLKHE